MHSLEVRTEPDRPVLLQVEAGSFRAPNGRAILSDIDLSVVAGSRLAIVGPNGAGKTSLLKLLAGRMRPTQGRVLLDGRPVHAMPARDRALRIAVMAQSDHPDLRLTVRDYVGLGRVPHRGRVPVSDHARIVAQALERVGLAAMAGRRLETLSGGERQRGAIARAVAQEPSLLVLDEPTNHLDPRARAEMLQLARDLGITVVAALHDLALVGSFADVVAVLKAGRLVAHGPPTAALAQSVVRDVFAMDCFETTNPATGRAMLVFDTPHP